MRVLSLIPPMTQLNTPYPSTAYLTGFLRSRGIDAAQEDLALALVLSLFTLEGLTDIRAKALALPEVNRSSSVHFFLDYFDLYKNTITPTIRFLQGKDSTLSHRINSRSYQKVQDLQFWMTTMTLKILFLGLLVPWGRTIKLGTSGHSILMT